MKILLLPALLVGVLGLSSCGLLRSAAQIPLRTLQTVTRSAGFGLKHSEEVKADQPVIFEAPVREAGE